MNNGKPDKYLFTGGYCNIDTISDKNMTFHYYNQDHLGNNREVVNENGTIEQVTNYYPFGAPYCDNTNTNADLQPYKYNGKELDLTHGLNTYDYGARQYNSIVPSWTSVDPLAEKYYNISPYVYCGNNPVNIIDPNGLSWYNDKKGNFHYVADDNNAKESWVLVGKYVILKNKEHSTYSIGLKDGSEVFLGDSWKDKDYVQIAKDAEAGKSENDAEATSSNIDIKEINKTFSKVNTGAGATGAAIGVRNAIIGATANAKNGKSLAST